MEENARRQEVRAAIRKAVKSSCIYHPCNHINCNKEVFGCINTDPEPIIKAMKIALLMSGQSQWAATVNAEAKTMRSLR